MEECLLSGQSPEDISGRLKEGYEKDIPYVSKESIYRYIRSPYGRRIESKLQKKKKPGRKRKSLKKLDDRTFVDKRPQYINDRKKIGDAEFDFIVSGRAGKGILLVVADRKIRISFLEPIYRTSVKAVMLALLKIKKRYPEWRTGTTDNDILFSKHKEIAKKLNIKIFFCHPYHSWEKGTVENVNGEIRKYLPKKSDISKYAPSFFRKVEEELNNRFMKCLKYRTPLEALTAHRKRKNLRKGRS